MSTEQNKSYIGPLGPSFLCRYCYLDPQGHGCGLLERRGMGSCPAHFRTWLLLKGMKE